MADQGTIHWEGKSGKRYRSWIYPIGTEFSGGPGNYMFAREMPTGLFRPIYAGETGDLSNRFDNHHKMPCIKREGATHICVHKSSENGNERRREEADIVARYNLVCNG
jgi:hypothetical protein